MKHLDNSDAHNRPDLGLMEISTGNMTSFNSNKNKFIPIIDTMMNDTKSNLSIEERAKLSNEFIDKEIETLIDKVNADLQSMGGVFSIMAPEGVAPAYKQLISEKIEYRHRIRFWHEYYKSLEQDDIVPTYNFHMPFIRAHVYEVCKNIGEALAYLLSIKFVFGQNRYKADKKHHEYVNNELTDLIDICQDIRKHSNGKQRK